MNALVLLQDVVNKYQVLLDEQQLLNVSPWGDILVELNNCLVILDTSSKEIDNYQLTVKHPIEQFGLENITMALYEQGSNYNEIAEYHNHRQFDITSKQVKEYIEQYSSQGILARVGATHGSIFDTEVQLQNLFDRLSKTLEQVESRNELKYAGSKITKDEVILQYCSEIRATIKDAASLTEAIANMQKVERFQQIVLEAINQESPTVRNKILRRLKQEKDLARGFM